MICTNLAGMYKLVSASATGKARQDPSLFSTLESEME